MGLEYGPKNGETNFNMKKVCVKAVQNNLSEVQNYERKQVCSQSSEKNEDGETFCNTMVTCHKTWLIPFSAQPGNTAPICTMGNSCISTMMESINVEYKN